MDLAALGARPLELGLDLGSRMVLLAVLQGGVDIFDDLAFLARQPVPQDTCYQYFKEALIVWTLVQSQKWFKAHDVRMNCVAPGPVFTPILGEFVTQLGEARVQADSARIRRPSFADEVAPAIAFLCSDDARAIVGANLPVDGGFAASYL